MPFRFNVFQNAISFLLAVVLFLSIPFLAMAETINPAGKLTPPKETFIPGDWFLGSTPPNLDPSKPPIVFVQGKNGSSTSWYGETVYHGINDMYTKAYEAGYQTVFVQLYDAAGKGSASQYANGELLSSLLGEISAHFGGKKVNIIAHSKGGPDTQAALIQYGAYKYVGKVFTLGSPHYGSNLADLAYSWYAGWLGTLLGQKDDGTYSLQTGEMAKFRSVVDKSSNLSKNKYYTIAGTNHGPAFSALSLGAAYLSSYGANDGLVNEWSAKLPYATHLFTDSTVDHDNIRMGSKVFTRMEPYLRNSSVSVAAKVRHTANPDDSESALSSSQYVNGGSLIAGNWTSDHFYIAARTKGTVSVLTYSPDAAVEFIAPDGSVYAGEQIPSIGFMEKASTYQLDEQLLMEGEWTVRIKSPLQQDAYLLTAAFTGGQEPFVLTMKGLSKSKSDVYTLRVPASSSKKDGSLTMAVHWLDPKGNKVINSEPFKQLDSTSYQAAMPDITEAGTYNMTIDIKKMMPDGKQLQRTIITSVYLEK
ncbi:esterase/lipase family protein [Bacillus sp. 1P06AnD]|uniref:esterase/lipase family protein n=1 Tax=Bacillus sp. 1P06AnD TaxID=3132208 RepID=UPI0039A02FBD